MDLNNLEQIDALKSIFYQYDASNTGLLNESELRNLLSYFEIDETFGPVMFRLLSMISRVKTLFTDSNDTETKPEQNGVSFDDFLNFFKLLISGTTKEFFALLFKAIDFNNNEKIGVKELVDFSKLMGDPIPNQEAVSIIDDCLAFNKNISNPAAEKPPITTRPVRSNTISARLSKFHDSSSFEGSSTASDTQFQDFSLRSSKEITFEEFWRWYSSEFPLSKSETFNLTQSPVTKSYSHNNMRSTLI